VLNPLKTITAQVFNWVFNPRYRLLTIISAMMIALLASTAVQLLRDPTPFNIGVLCFFAYCALHILYEYTINRTRVPTFSSSPFARRFIANAFKRDALKYGLLPYCIIDLGSGDGTLTRHISRTIPSAQITGIEQGRLPFYQSMVMKKLLGLKNISYKQDDFFTFDCAKIGGVVMFLSGNMTIAVGKKLFKELKAGALVITNEFPLLGDWPTPKKITSPGLIKTTLFVYRK
jgi:hypothetical protein